MFPGLIGAIIIGGIALFTGAVAVSRLLYICEPNEVLIFSGKKSKPGYKLIHSGRKIRIPLFEEVDRLDLTNMVIDLSVSNAYSKGGIPLSIKGVANVKIGSHPPHINNGIERLMGMTRAQIAQIARENLEGNLRGVLATLTPEEVNTDRMKFAQELLDEAEQDMTRIGLVLDTLKIQSVTDDRGYLDSLGRRQSAELQMNSRIAEAENRAEARIKDAANNQTKAIAKVKAEMDVSRAEAERRILDAQTKGQAMIAEQRSQIGSAVAKAEANIDVQKARLEQVKRKLDADVIKPAQARRAELQAKATADAAKIVEEGKANAAALRELLATWRSAGDAARSVFMMQQFDTVFDSLLSTVQDIDIDKVTMIDASVSKVDENGSLPMRAASGTEQLKQTLGVDVPAMLTAMAATKAGS